MSRDQVHVRELVGWGLDSYEYRPETIKSHALAKAANLVAHRPPFEAQDAVLENLTAKIRETLIPFALRPDLISEMSGLSWSLGVVDLRSLVAFQRRLAFPHTNPPGAVPTAEDWAALLELSFAAAQPVECEAIHDDRAKTLVVQSTNPNLHIRATGDPASPLVIHSGGPFFEVACFRKRWFLRDGYHRAYALLQAGVYALPAVIIQAATIDELGANQPWFFPQEVLFSDSPPLVTDFLAADLVIEYDRPPLIKTLRIKIEETLIPPPHKGETS